MLKAHAAVLIAALCAAPCLVFAQPAASGAAAQWKQIYEDNQTIYYVSATNSASSTTSDVESLLEYKVPQVLGGTQVWSVVSHMKLDCDARKVVTLDNTTYSRPMGAGRAIQTQATTDSMHEPDPGSLGELIWTTACGKS